MIIPAGEFQLIRKANEAIIYAPGDTTLCGEKRRVIAAAQDNLLDAIKGIQAANQTPVTRLP